MPIPKQNTYILRPYQLEAVEAGLSIIAESKNKNGTRRKCVNNANNGILVLPTASGKALVIAEIARRSNLKTVVLQPTKEILEQNLTKLKEFGIKDIGVYSASMNCKTIGKVTVATIGSIIRHKELFKGFELVIVDECDLVNSKEGQYAEFLESFLVPVIGTTATPWRMRHYNDAFGDGLPVVESRFLTRTKPKIFRRITHITQIPDMFEQGYLCPLKYAPSTVYDSRKVKSNSTGQGYVENDLFEYNESQGVVSSVIKSIVESTAKHSLIFTNFRKESKQVVQGLAEYGIKCKEISSELKKHDREETLKQFKAGKCCVVNVGVLVAGFDFPALDEIILAKPTKSLRLYCQMTGRGLRIAPGKLHCSLIDLCDNVKRFGKINSFVIEDISDGHGLWRLNSDKGYLTGVNVLTGKDLERNLMERHSLLNEERKEGFVVSFGRYSGTRVEDLNLNYLQWCVAKFDAKNSWKFIFECELKRRSENKGEEK